MKVLITGAKGQIGTCLMEAAEGFNINVVGYGSKELDITSPTNVKAIFNLEKPDVVINTAAYTNVDAAETNIEAAYKINDFGTSNLAKECEILGIPFLHISTDYIFDGKAGNYNEDDICNPINVYGASKLAGEISAKKACSKTIILRTGWVFSEYGKNFLKTMIALGKTKSELRIVADQFGAPTSAHHIADALFCLAELSLKDDFDFNNSTFNFCGNKKTNWHEFAHFIISRASYLGVIRYDPKVIAIKSEEYLLPAKRPQDSYLKCDKIFKIIPQLDNRWEYEAGRIIKTL